MTLRILTAGLLLGAGILAGCSSATSSSGSGTPTVIKTISGTVSGGSNVKIGVFYDASGTLDFVNSTGPSDPGTAPVVADGLFTTSGSYTPVTVVTPDGSGKYSITLPSNPKQTVFVVTWSDANGDGKFDLGTEGGIFPTKSISGISYAIEGFGYLDTGSGSLEYYLASYWKSGDSSYHNDALDTIGASGFNFQF